MAIILMGGCSAMKMEEGCSYVREVKTSYQCEAGGKVEHWKIDSYQ